MKDNWYIVLELEYDPAVNDENIIKARIEEKLRFWSTHCHDFRNGSSYKMWMESAAQIRKDMLGSDNIRAQLAKEARDAAYGQIDGLLKLVGEEGSITPEELEKLSKKLGEHPDRITKRAKALGINIVSSGGNPYSDFMSKKPEGLLVYQTMKKLLDTIGVQDLYEFLFEDSYSSVKNTRIATAALRQRTEDKKKDFRKNSQEDSIGLKLCGHCEKIFADEKNREDYDSYLVFSRVTDTLREAVSVSEIKGRLSDTQSSHYIELLGSAMGCGQSEALEFFKSFCDDRNISAALPDIAPKQQPRKPAETPRIFDFDIKSNLQKGLASALKKIGEKMENDTPDFRKKTERSETPERSTPNKVKTFLSVPGAAGVQRNIFYYSSPEFDTYKMNVAGFDTAGKYRLLKPDLGNYLNRVCLHNFCESYSKGYPSPGDLSALSKDLHRGGDLANIDSVPLYFLMPEWFSGQNIYEAFRDNLKSFGINVSGFVNETRAVAAAFMAEKLRLDPQWLAVGEIKNVFIVITGNNQTEITSFTLGSDSSGRYIIKRAKTARHISDTFYKAMVTSYLVNCYDDAGGVIGFGPYKKFTPQAERLLAQLSTGAQSASVKLKGLTAKAAVEVTANELRTKALSLTSYARAFCELSNESKYMSNSFTAADQQGAFVAARELESLCGVPECAGIYSYQNTSRTARAQLERSFSGKYEGECVSGGRYEAAFFGAGIITALRAKDMLSE